MTSDTSIEVTHASWVAESWQMLVTSPANFSNPQRPSVVNFDIFRRARIFASFWSMGTYEKWKARSTRIPPPTDLNSNRGIPLQISTVLTVCHLVPSNWNIPRTSSKNTPRGGPPMTSSTMSFRFPLPHVTVIVGRYTICEVCILEPTCI